MELPLKVRLCRHFENGYCKRGETCNFAHGLNDLNFQTTTSIVYGVERPSSQSPKPPEKLLAGVISREEWHHVLDSTSTTANFERGVDKYGWRVGPSRQATTFMGDPMAKLSPDSIAWRPKVPVKEQKGTGVHSVHENVPRGVPEQNVNDPLHPWVEPDWVHRLLLPDTGGTENTTRGYCVL